MEKRIENVLPVMAVEHDCIVSKQGDITVIFKVELPEIFTLSDQEYEAFHQSWIKAVKILPKFCVFHKQDWFLEQHYKADFVSDDSSFLTRSSEQFFNERPFLDHSCYIMLTKKPSGRKNSSSLFSNLLRSSIVPEETLNPQLLQDFIDCTGQFKRIMEDSGFVKLTRLKNNELKSDSRKKGLIERYCFLSEREDSFVFNDITFNQGLEVGDKHCQLFTLGDAADLPALCGSRINFDRYSTDKTKFSIGFASTLGQLLSCNHIYNQYLFLEDAQKTIQKLESKRLRLQSLSAYSRENMIARDATNDFLNEAVSQQRLPVKAHFNVLAWSTDTEELKEIKNKVSSALAQMDAAAKQETTGAPQIYWAGIPGNAADFPMNDTFDTFTEQAVCFLNMETGYRSSLSPVGIRLGDRLTGAEYLRYLFKTVRKFFGEAIVVTQEVEDIISSPVVKQAIINNSDCKILLDQSKYQNKFDQIQELLGLTEKEKALVLSVNKANDPDKKYKEVFISLGGISSKVYRTEVSLNEYLAYTTEESEKVKMNAYAAKFGGNIEKGIAALAQDMRNGI
jgi:conjugation system TraG family ATPase